MVLANCFALKGVDGDMRGAIRPHLRAITSILEQTESPLKCRDTKMASFLAEQYLYLQIVSNYAGFDANQTYQTQSIIDALAGPFCSQMLHSTTFGCMFGSSFTLMKLIPEVAELAHRPAPSEPRCWDLEILAEYFRLESLILTWEPSTVPPSEPFSDSGLLNQHALLILLRVALNGPGYPTGTLKSEIDDLIAEFVSLVTVLPLVNAVWANLMWALITIGSCILDAEQQESLRFTMNSLPNTMHIVRRLVQVLGWIWEEAACDPDAYGPFGITHISKKYGVTLSMG